MAMQDIKFSNLVEVLVSIRITNYKVLNTFSKVVSRHRNSCVVDRIMLQKVIKKFFLKRIGVLRGQRPKGRGKSCAWDGSRVLVYSKTMLHHSSMYPSLLFVFNLIFSIYVSTYM